VIVKTPYGVSPSYELTIGNVEVDYLTVNSLVLSLEENKHDMLTIEMGGLPPRAITQYRNKGVSLTFNTGTGFVEYFYGYVIDVKPKSETGGGMINNSPFQESSVICLGVSYDMRGPVSKVWERTPLHEVVQLFARGYGFSASVPYDDLVYGMTLQEAESDWQFLVRYANLLGYSVTAHGTHLHVFDPYAASTRGISQHRLTTLSTTTGIRPEPGQITEFSGSFADRRADGMYADSVVTVMADDGQGEPYDVTIQDVLGIQGVVPRFKKRVPHHVDTYAEAERVLLRTAKATYDYEAAVSCLGLAGCKPGGVVLLDNYKSEFDGLWYVQSVKHTIATGVFLSDLHIVRNTRSDLDSYKVVSSMKSPPLPTWQVDKWKAEKRIVDVY
jgi:phage protein D